MKSPHRPMEFRSADVLPPGDWQFEPKWDGFRCVVARDRGKIELISKAGQPLARYFPEVAQRCLEMKPQRFAIDGEIIMRSARASFDDLLQRIHPAATRVEALARTMPTQLMVFDLLVDDRGKDLTSLPLEQRREKLEGFARAFFGKAAGIALSPATRSRSVANKWLSAPRAAMDGVIAKKIDAPYRPGSREGGVKVKRVRTADCVVGGFRYASKGGVIGSLLLGLYDRQGKLNHVGFTSSFSDRERKALVAKLKPLIKAPGFTGKAPGGPSRWSTSRTEEWEPLAPKLVVEVAFDRVTNDRIRHGARFIRWRPDKAPGQCTLDQLK
jgi:ATP-dependent DNA ligase